MCRNRVMKYLEGAVYEGFVQVDNHTVLAVVCYTDLRQEEFGWRLQRQHTTFTILCTEYTQVY